MTLRKSATIAFVIYALFNLWTGVGIIGGGYFPWGLPLLIAAGVIGFAVRQRDDAPRRSTIMLVVACAVPAATLYWMAPIFVLVWVLLSWLAIASEPGRRQPVPAAT